MYMIVQMNPVTTSITQFTNLTVSAILIGDHPQSDDVGWSKLHHSVRMVTDQDGQNCQVN